VRSALVAAVAALVLAACSVQTGASDTAATISQARRDVRASTFSLVDGADAVVVRTADLGPDLYRISTPEDARVRPQVSVDGGIVHLHLAQRDGRGRADVQVLLNRDVRWRLDVQGGTGSLTADLREGEVVGVDVVGGSGAVALSLPSPRGTVPIRMVGGTSSWTVVHPAEVPVRVTASAGAGTVDVDGDRRSGVAAGTIVATTGYPAAFDRYDLDAVGGVGTLVVRRSEVAPAHSV
jgi:hypothetical protein